MRRILLPVVAALALTGGAAGPAAASCAPPIPMGTALDDAPAVFVGTVRDVTNGDRWATVEVTDVWKGDVDALVQVKAGPKDPPGPLGAASSVDRTYREGKTYLFVPHSGRGIEFQDSICSATTVYRDALDRFRPADAVRPPGDAVVDDSATPWWAIGAAAAAAVAGATLLLRRRAAA